MGTEPAPHPTFVQLVVRGLMAVWEFTVRGLHSWFLLLFRIEVGQVPFHTITMLLGVHGAQVHICQGGTNVVSQR